MDNEKPADDRPAPLTDEERRRRIQAAIDRDGAEVALCPSPAAASVPPGVPS